MANPVSPAMPPPQNPLSNSSSPSYDPTQDPTAPNKWINTGVINPAWSAWFNPQRQQQALDAEKYRQSTYGSSIEQNAKNQLNDQSMGALYDQTAGAGALQTLRNARSPEDQQVISAAMSRMGGLTSGENTALRHNNLATINAQNQSALSMLRGSQAASGVRGGLAGAQMAQQNAAATGMLGQAEGNLITQNAAMQNQGIQNAATIVNGQENTERNMAADKLSLIMQGRGAGTAQQGAQLQANAAASSGGGK